MCPRYRALSRSSECWCRLVAGTCGCQHTSTTMSRIWKRSGRRSAADRRDDRYLGAVRDWCRQPFQITYVFIANEDVDMLADFALFVREAIAEPGITRPQCQQNIAK